MKENKFDKKFWLSFAGIVAALGLGAWWYWGYYLPNQVIVTDPDTDKPITNRDYSKEADMAISVLNQMAAVPDNPNNAKIDVNTGITTMADLIVKYPQIQTYAQKFLTLDNASKAALVFQGISIALSTAKKPAISARSITEKKPIWLLIIDETFKNA